MKSSSFLCCLVNSVIVSSWTLSAFLAVSTISQPPSSTSTCAGHLSSQSMLRPEFVMAVVRKIQYHAIFFDLDVDLDRLALLVQADFTAGYFDRIQTAILEGDVLGRI